MYIICVYIIRVYICVYTYRYRYVFYIKNYIDIIYRMVDIYDKIFNLLDLKDDKINIIEFINCLETRGIYKIDPRLKEMKDKIDKNKKKGAAQR